MLAADVHGADRTDEPPQDPLHRLYRLRWADTPLIVCMSAVAAIGGALWLGAGPAAGWFVTVAALTGLDRLICRRLCGGVPPPSGRWRFAEPLLALETLVYTLVYCTLPLALVAHGGHMSIIAGLAMMGAIAVGCTSEFVISRLVGSAAMLGLTAMTVTGVVWGAHPQQWLMVAFALVAVLAFFGYVLEHGLSSNRTERRMAEALAMARANQAEAAAANAAKSVFLATMSHEIRTPLNGVLGMAQAMEIDGLPQVQRERLAVIRSCGEVLLTILNDVLDLSKIEAGKLELETIAFDLGAVIDSVEQAFAPRAAEKGLAYVSRITPEAAGAYMGDPTRLGQILFNLVSNAVKFTRRGAVSLLVEHDREGLRLVVADTGPGVPADKLGGLFAKFTQVDASTTRRHGGSGLGLAICRELTEMMGGRIRAESEYGRGSRFTVSLPLARVEIPRVEARDGEGLAPAACEGLKVLAAEDNPVNQLVLATLLSQIGVELTMVENGEEALAAWEDGEWSLILMDVQMPVMDGVSATREIRRREAGLGRGRTPIIALTANAMSHQTAEYAEAGMDRFVGKPIEVASLYAAIGWVLDDTAAASAA
jgi:signal transduction histidine kinase/CheY-like chemotaxis protein